MNHWQSIRRSILLIFGCACGYYLIFGTHGLAEYYIMHKQLEKEKNKIEQLQKNILNIKNAIARSGQNPFEIERVARYDLSLGCTNEMVYLIKKG